MGNLGVNRQQVWLRGVIGVAFGKVHEQDGRVFLDFN